MNKRQVGAWALFDFANSVYPAVIVSVVFQIYFIEAIVGNEAGEGDAWWGRAVSLSALIVALSAPVLGAVADRAGVRKRFMALCVAMCITGVVLFTTLEPGMVLYGFVVFLIANVGFEACLIFYNAYLPDIVPPEKQGWVSGLGFGVGYAGSALGLVMVLPFATTNIQVVWVMVASMFLVFSMPTFLYLPKDEAGSMSVPQAAIWGLTSFRELWGEVMAQKELRRYLLAYFFYIDGVLTAIYMSSTLASNTFGYEQAELIYLYLAIQIAALIGAFLLAKPTDRVGPKKVVTGVLGLWITIAIAIFFIESKAAFAVVGLLAGFGLGSIQAASRAFMASLIPDGRESEMFGFYALCGKSSSVIGPLIFGQVALMTGGNQKLSVMSISVLFVFGAILLQRVKDPKAAPVAA
ncbi:MAG: MFS transporter [Gemmatimonadota bacterium]|nr:MFS transporter [Gemmatimonadota bacterium]MDE3006267.1 MFS transporter [Gemmatimonadota bacterium]MDE3014028.1 MFS transporter [Gemmatimonadota bacterium]